MKKWCSVRFFSLIFLFWCLWLRSREFLYPVAVIERDNEGPRIYLLYQKSTMHVELWLWDPETKTINKGLLSSYIPAGLKILPDKSGFSFIDNGRIRIKFFERRSPRSLELYEPLYNISTVEWIDNDCFCLGAKKGNEYGIFQVNKYGDVTTVAAYDGVDCMYPQKIENKLFYVERSSNPQHYQIVCVPYPVLSDKAYNFNDIQHNANHMVSLILGEESSMCPLIKKGERNLIYSAGKCPIIFLQMISDVEGFYIERPGSIDRSDKIITFHYHSIKKEGERWNSSSLFSFSIPSHLILSSSPCRLHESILPLIPRHKGKKIYFSDCFARSDQRGLDLFCYSLQDGHIQQLSFGTGKQQFFSPLFVGNTVFYGSSLVEEENPLNFDLPRLKL